MKRILLTLLTAYLAISHTNCIPFCDIQSIDNVFNIGHLVYMTRCGEVWTYDPRMDGGAGGFLRDYTVFTFARRHFGPHIVEKFGKYDKDLLRFAAFSFQEVNCLKNDEDLKRSCARSVEKWNSLSVIADNKSAHVFRYDTELTYNENEQDWENPMAMTGKEDMDTWVRTKFWPDINVVARDQFPNDPQKSAIHSGLFVVDQNRLYIALRTEKYYCITHLSMDLMLHNISEWPSTPGSNYLLVDWAKAYCFTGNLVGMFYDLRYTTQRVLIVGRVRYDSREYEDQVYSMDYVGNGVVNIRPQYVSNKERTYQNLRTWFGCKPEPSKPQTKRKRSVEAVNNEKMRETVKIDNNWIQMTLLSAVVLFLLYAIVRYSTDTQFRARILKSE